MLGYGFRVCQVFGILDEKYQCQAHQYLAYSAGSQVLSPGLVAIRRRYIRDSSIPLRLGENLLRCPDLSFPALLPASFLNTLV